MAEFYSATTRLSDRFRGPLLLRDLQLQRHHQTIISASGTQPDQAFTALHHCSGDKSLQAIEVGAPFCIALPHETGPKGVGGLVSLGVA